MGARISRGTATSRTAEGPLLDLGCVCRGGLSLALFGPRRVSGGTGGLRCGGVAIFGWLLPEEAGAEGEEFRGLAVWRRGHRRCVVGQAVGEEAVDRDDVAERRRGVVEDAAECVEAAADEAVPYLVVEDALCAHAQLKVCQMGFDGGVRVPPLGVAHAEAGVRGNRAHAELHEPVARDLTNQCCRYFGAHGIIAS